MQRNSVIPKFQSRAQDSELNPDEGNFQATRSMELFAVLMSAGLDLTTLKSMMEHKKKTSYQMKENNRKLHQENTRRWSLRRTKKKVVDHHEKYRKTLKTYFDSLKSNKDYDYIQIEDLEDPFITLGLAKSRQEVRRIVEVYDDNGNGKIEFDEFLEILDGRLHAKGDSLFSRKRTTFQEFFRSKENWLTFSPQLFYLQNLDMILIP